MKPASTDNKYSDSISHFFDIFPKNCRQSFCTHSVIPVCLALVVITLAVYLQAGNHQFLGFDDNVYVTGNPNVTSGITGKNIIWAFTSFDAANWHPITWLSHMADSQFYGVNPRGHHLTNVMIHTVSSLLLLLLLHRLTGALWQSSFVAVLFALHPLHVESVAWVAERKDVLSAFFWFLTLFFYAEFSVKRKPALYILCLFSFMLGLMSKPMLVTLPIVMLLMDFWPLDRYRHEEREKCSQELSGRALSLIKEKIPFFACSLLSGLITIYAQHMGGATSSLEAIPFVLRIENALIAYVKYIIKTLWPGDLAVLYPFSSSLPLWQVIGSLFALILVTLATMRVRRRHPFLAVGWFWFLVTLLPVIGLIQVGSQSMADRYSYIPVTGLFIMAAWGVPILTKGLKHQKATLALLAGTVIAASATLTWKQLGYWHDSVSLYRHTLHVTSGNYAINCNLGVELAEKGDLEAAIQAHHESIRINPNYSESHYNLGYALDKKGDMDTAIMEYQLALQLNPNNTRALINLGADLSEKGDLDAAIKKYHEALRISHNDMKAHYNLGRAYTKKGNLDFAVQEFQAALRISPNDTNSHTSLGLALAEKGDLDAAIQEYKMAIKISPDNKEAHNNLGVALVNKGDLDAAIQGFQNVLRLSSNDINAHSNLGVAFAKKGDLDAAIREFQNVIWLSPDDTYARNYLGRVLVQKKMIRRGNP